MAKVRLFTHEGMQALKIATYSGHNAENAIWELKQPYYSRDVATPDQSTPYLSDVSLSNNLCVNVLRLEIEEGKRVRYEITGPNLDTPRTADQNSPVLFGTVNLIFGKGMRISLIEDADA